MTLTLTDHLGAADAGAALRADVLAGLTATPKTLPPRWFYDERGSELFDEITRLPEYYPTRTERALLAAHAGDIAAASGPDTLVELGSGTSEKTRLLLEALAEGGTLRRFVPVDVDPSVLRAAGAAIIAEHPDIAVDAVVADFTTHLDELPQGGRRLVA
ncbi:MAG: methyltransferase, partial [Modestobacter sp.]|nr:methyltransferase [Modestobacter sp.]